jgi:hypothetical protein
MARPKEIKGHSTQRNMNLPIDTLNAFLEIKGPNFNLSAWVREKMEEAILEGNNDNAVFGSDRSALGQMATNIQCNNNAMNFQVAFDSLGKLLEFSKNNSDAHYINKALPKTNELLRVLKHRQVITGADKMPEYRPSKVLGEIARERERRQQQQCKESTELVEREVVL